MILTCPDCATSYFVDQLRIPPHGRMVKCTSCGARWRALPEEAEAGEAAPPAEPAIAVEEEVAPSPDVPEDDLEFVAAPVTPARGSSPRRRGPGLLVGGALAGLLVVGLGAVVVLREQVAGMVPGTAPLFAAVGLPVNELGLVIEGVTSKPGFQAGRPVLAVTGAIRSTAHEPAHAPPIRIRLLDKAGKPLANLLAEPLNAKVPPGAKRYFAVTLPDPPAGAHELEIAFDPGAARAAPAARAHASPAHE